MDLYLLLAEPSPGEVATATYRSRVADAEAKIRADERAKIVAEIAQIARDNMSAGRPTRAAWSIQLAERIKKGPAS